MNKEGTEKEVIFVTRYGLEMNTERIPQIVREETYESEQDTFTSPEEIDSFCRNVLHLNRQCEEHLYLISMNAKGHVQGLFEISHGSATMTFCDLKTIAIRMLLAGGISAIIVHNHPSGSTEPSFEDERMAERIEEVANLIDEKLLDFIIVGNNYYSFSEHGKIK